MTKYDSGRRVEYAVQKWLAESIGKYGTTRSAGSKGAFDVIAYNPYMVRFIQVKRETAKTSYKADLSRMEGVELPPSCSKELWVYTKGKGFTLIYVLGDIPVELSFPDGAEVVYV